MAQTPPFTIDETKPADDDFISQHPALARLFRDIVESWNDLEHGAASGRHKIPSGTVAARNAITDWEHGSFWINEDVTPNELQINIGTKATPNWISVTPLTGNNTWTGTNEFQANVTLSSADAGAGEGPVLDMFRNSASPAAADLIAAIALSGNSSTAVKRTYAKLLAKIIDPTNAAEDSELHLQTLVAGALADRLILGQGAYTPNAKGGDKGADTLNVGHPYQHGVSLLPRGHIDGLILSNNGVDPAHDIDIAAGQAVDDGQNAIMARAATLTKRLDAAWAVGSGNGGLDTGTIAATTWYHVWLIRRSDTGVVDALFSLSATAPTMPTNYDQKRRIGAVLTDGSANVIGFSQVGDEFLWNTPVNDFSSTNPGTSAALRALTVPTGVQVQAIVMVGIEETSFANPKKLCLVTSPDQSDTAPTSTLYTFTVTTASAGGSVNGEANMKIRTDTSAQIRTRVNASNVAMTIKNTTYGWVDPRGRDA